MNSAPLLRASGVIFAAILALATPTHAQESAKPHTPPYQPGNIIVIFDGGDVGNNMAKVLTALNGAPNLLPVTTRTLGPNEDPCKVMTSLGFPPSCDAMRPLLAKLNKGLNARALPVGHPLTVPDLRVYPRRAARTYSSADASQQITADGLVRHWATKGVVKEQNAAAERITYDTYELVIPTTGETQDRALKLLNSFASANVGIEPIWEKSRPARSFSSAFSEEAVRNECGPAGLPSTRRYQELSDVDASVLRNLVDPPPGSPALPALPPPTVFIVDEPLDDSPNLVDALADGAASVAPGGSWSCAWGAFNQGRDHATHMAGIIASRGRGFEGVAPKVQLKPVPWLAADPNNPNGPPVAPGDRVRNFKEVLDEHEHFNQVPQNIYLIASEFDAPTIPLDNGQLADPAKRPRDSPDREINGYRPLLIVAAGQEDNAEAAHHLSDRYPRSPENLGDWPNVLVITACEICTRHGARLWLNANYSATAVHLAAPGGAPIPGWISKDQVGAASGTSQSAAYVAGVAAAMIWRYPRLYVTAAAVKERLQTTAWPILDGVDSHEGDFQRVAVGLVDPVLAQLDPSKHWIKDSAGWREVKLRRAPDLAGFTDNSGEAPAVHSRTVRRVVRVLDSRLPLFALLTEDSPNAVVGRYGPLSLSAQSSPIQTCAGSVDLQNLYDLVIALPGVGPNECAH